MGNLAYEYEEERDFEIYDGEVVMMAGASIVHNIVVENIINLFMSYLRGRKCRVFGENVRVYLERGVNEVLPDIKIVCDLSKLDDNGIYGAPDLIAEVLSPTTASRDKREKFELYEKHGVREYWVVSAGDRSIEQYELADGKYKLAGVYCSYRTWEFSLFTEKERAEWVRDFKTTLYDDFTINIDDVFKGIEYKY